MLKEDFKTKRSELDDILLEMDIPKLIFHIPVELNLFIYGNRRFHPDAQKALDLLYELSNQKLTRFNLNPINEE